MFWNPLTEGHNKQHVVREQQAADIIAIWCDILNQDNIYLYNT